MTHFRSRCRRPALSRAARLTLAAGLALGLLCCARALPPAPIPGPRPPPADAVATLQALLAELQDAGYALRPNGLPRHRPAGTNAAERFRAWAATLPPVDAEPTTPHSGPGVWQWESAAARRATAAALLARWEPLAEALGPDLADGWWGWYDLSLADTVADRELLCRAAIALADQAYIEAHYGDSSRAYAAVTTVFLLAGSLRHEPDLLGQFTRLQVTLLACYTLEQVLRVRELPMNTGQDLVGILRAARDLNAGIGYRGEIVTTATLAVAAIAADPARHRPARDLLMAYSNPGAADSATLATAANQALWAWSLETRLRALVHRLLAVDPAAPGTPSCPRPVHPSNRPRIPSSSAMALVTPHLMLPILEGDASRLLASCEALLILRLYRLRQGAFPPDRTAAETLTGFPWPLLPPAAGAGGYGEVTPYPSYIATRLPDSGVITAVNLEHLRQITLTLDPRETDPAYRPDSPRNPLLDLAPPPLPPPPGDYDPAKNAAEYYVRAGLRLRDWHRAHDISAAHLPLDPTVDWAAMNARARLQTARVLLRAEDSQATATLFLRATSQPAHWLWVRYGAIADPAPPALQGPALDRFLRDSSLWLLSRAYVSAHYQPDAVAWLSIANVLHLLISTADLPQDRDLATTRLALAAQAADLTVDLLQVADPDPRSAAILLGLLQQTQAADGTTPAITHAVDSLSRRLYTRGSILRTWWLCYPGGDSLPELQRRLDTVARFGAIDLQPLRAEQYAAIITLLRQRVAPPASLPATNSPDDQLLHLQTLLLPDADATFDAVAALRRQQTDTRARLALARTVLALRVHHLRHGAYPDTLNDITPELKLERPTDPHRAGLLHYQKEGAGFTLRSVGPDGQPDTADDLTRRDTGARQPTERQQAPTPAENPDPDP